MSKKEVLRKFGIKRSLVLRIRNRRNFSEDRELREFDSGNVEDRRGGKKKRVTYRTRLCTWVAEQRVGKQIM